MMVSIFNDKFFLMKMLFHQQEMRIRITNLSRLDEGLNHFAIGELEKCWPK